MCRPLLVLCILIGGGGAAQGSPAQGNPAQEDLVDFAAEVLPILSDKCFVCHGPDSPSRQLRLDRFETATAPRAGGRALDPEQPERSLLLERIHSEDDPMPPEGAERQLLAAERELLSRWVRQGGRYAEHWAFVPPRKASLPEADPAEGPADPAEGPADPAADPVREASAAIDAFVGAGLRGRGLDFAPAADPATLARRVALVLTGLPPEPADRDAFLADPDPEAYAALVERLLHSPRFGEHQARYWLDAVRYGDTHGLHLDNRRGIYPYRDWVVRAFDEGLALDDFLTWQLAGDLLPDPGADPLLATGFVRMNPSTAEGGAIPDEFQCKNSFDRTETVGTVLLGLSLVCARCHNHKYDPISQREYYQLLAFLDNTAEGPMDGNAYEYGPTLRVPADDEAWAQWRGLESERDAALAAAEQDLRALPGEQAEQQAAQQVQERAAELARWLEQEKAARWQQLVAEDGPFANRPEAEPARALAPRIVEAEARFTTSLIARELPTPRPTRVLFRGEYDQPRGEVLSPDVPAVLGGLPEGAPRDRLGLARWITSPGHPLVARVLVNRLWQRTFGLGLVRTPEDFGKQGRRPTHPPLLDWLSVELHDCGWDLRHMLRAMVHSRSFQQSSAWRAELDDPENLLWGRGPGHRLDAEVLRDLGLWASGLLDPRRGGEGVKPYQPSGMWKAMAHPASNTREYVPDEGSKLYRRSLYVYWKRTSPHPMMTLFDAPDRESSCVRRSRTSTALQSLALFNETQRTEMARMLAQRLLREHEGDDARLEAAFRMLSCRPPDDVERRACRDLLEDARRRFAADPEAAKALLSHGAAPRDASLDLGEHAAWTQVATVLLASDLALLLY